MATTVQDERLIVTAHAACRAVLRDSARFPAGPVTDAGAAAIRRRCAYQALAPQRRAISLTPTMERIARDLVVGLLPGRRDLVHDLARPYAEAVLGHYFGLPQPAWHDDHDSWLDELRPRDDGAGPVIRAIRSRQARHTLVRALQAALVERRRQPHHDVLTALAQAADTHPGFTDADTVRIIPALANNALLGLTDLGGAVLWRLLARPSLAETAAVDARLLINAIEEVLRLDAPVQAVQRSATAGAELAGAILPADAPVLVRLAAANRDAAVFPDPDRLAPHRANAADHLSFGFGRDYCLGAPLVRRATVILATTFLARRASIRLADDAPVEHWANPFNRGLKRLDVRVSE